MADMFLSACYQQSSFMGSVYPTYVTFFVFMMLCVSLFNTCILRNGVHEITNSVILSLLLSFKTET
jgi:hypothetical protein